MSSPYDDFLKQLNREGGDPIPLIEMSTDIEEIVEYATTTLKHEKLASLTVTLNAVMRKFMEMYDSASYSWLLRAVVLTDLVWKKRQLSWLPPLNERISAIAHKRQDAGTAEQILHQFQQHAQWTDNPRELGYEDLGWMKYHADQWAHITIIVRIFEQPFATEKDYLFWQLEHAPIVPNSQRNTYRIDEDCVSACIQRLKQIDAYTSHFDNVLDRLWVDFVQRLNAMLVMQSAKGHAFVCIAQSRDYGEYRIGQLRKS